MTDQSNTEQLSTETAFRHRRMRLLIVGSVMWGLCFAGLFFVWYQRQHKVLAQDTQSTAPSSDEDDGRSGKQLKLVPQKDGTFVAQEVTKEDEANPWPTEGIEDFSFTDSSGKTITRQDLLGKPFIVAFIFTKCLGPCPNVTLQMRELQDRLKDYDFNLVSLTVDPERDTLDVLQDYGSRNHANFDRWRFLTGKQEEIYGLIHRSFLMPVEEATGEKRQPGFEIIHSTNIMLVDDTGHVIGKYNAQKDDEMARLRRDLKKAAKPLSTAKKSIESLEPDNSEPPSLEEPTVRKLPSWAATLPAVNAGLNGLAGLMLIVGFLLIKQRKPTAHAWVMVSAFITSIVFLGCYVVYHYALHHYTGEPGKRFGHSGTSLALVYLFILLTHVILAAVVPILASITLYRAWRRNWLGHRRIAVITFPIWVYVSVTGVIIYVMLYHWPGSSL